MINDDDGDIIPKPEENYTDEEMAVQTFNDKALNAIITNIDYNLFRLIINCTAAKDAWDILERQFEGNQSVKKSKLRILTSKWNSVRMEDSDGIETYGNILLDMSNQFSSLGKPMSNQDVVDKMLSSIPERFNFKITGLEDSPKLEKMDLLEVVSMLKSWEMTITTQRDHKKKGIALQANLTEDEVENGLQLILDGSKKVIDYELYNALVMRYNNAIKPGSFSTPRSKNEFVANSDRKKKKFNTAPGKNKQKVDIDSVVCHACSGIGHYANECPNTLRKYGKKNLFVSLSDTEGDEDDEEEEEENQLSLVAALRRTSIGNVNLNVDTPKPTPKSTLRLTSSSEETSPHTSARMLEFPDINCWVAKVVLDQTEEAEEVEETGECEALSEELMTRYADLYDSWKKQAELIEVLKRVNRELEDSMIVMDEKLRYRDAEVKGLRKEVLKAKDTFKKLNKGSATLNEVLFLPSVGSSGIGFDSSSKSKTDDKPKVVFKKEKSENLGKTG